jgi:hypothetical protein
VAQFSVRCLYLNVFKYWDSNLKKTLLSSDSHVQYMFAKDKNAINWNNSKQILVLLLKLWSFLNTVLNFIEHTQFSLFRKMMCDLHSDANYLFGPLTFMSWIPWLKLLNICGLSPVKLTLSHRISDLRGMLKYVFQITPTFSAWTFF